MVEAYSPLAQFKKELIENEAITSISAAHSILPSQTILAYLLAKGFVVLPRSSKEAHITQNIQLEGITLSPEDIEQIDSFGKK